MRARDAPIETSKFMGHGICDYVNKTVSLPNFTSDIDVLTKSILSIYKSSGIPPSELRGIGIQITKLNTSQNDCVKSNSLVTLFNNIKQKNLESSVIKSDIKTKEMEEIIANQIIIKPKQIKSPDKMQKILNKKATGRFSKTSCNAISENKTAIHNIFQNIAKNYEEPERYDDIDPEVLASLPYDIREEVLRDHKLNRKQKSITEKYDKFNVDSKFLQALPPKLRKEVEKEISAQISKLESNQTNSEFKESSSEVVSSDQRTINHLLKLPENKKEFRYEDAKKISDNIFLKNEWQLLLKSWINSTDTPFTTDIQILGDHARDLFILKKWDDLFVKLRYLHR